MKNHSSAEKARRWNLNSHSYSHLILLIYKCLVSGSQVNILSALPQAHLHHCDHIQITHTHTVTREFPLNCRCTLQSKHQCLSYMMFTTTKTSKTRSTKGCHLSEACREDKSLHLISLTTTRSVKPAQINNFRTVSQWLYFLPSVFQHRTQRMLDQQLLYKCLDRVFKSKIKAQ